MVGISSSSYFISKLFDSLEFFKQSVAPDPLLNSETGLEENEKTHRQMSCVTMIAIALSSTAVSTTAINIVPSTGAKESKTISRGKSDNLLSSKFGKPAGTQSAMTPQHPSPSKAVDTSSREPDYLGKRPDGRGNVPSYAQVETPPASPTFSPFMPSPMQVGEPAVAYKTESSRGINVPHSPVNPAEVAIPLSRETTVLPGKTTVLPGKMTVLPGKTTTLPGTTTVLPGITTTLPGITTTLPGITTTLPGTTTTLPGTTTTLPGASLVGAAHSAAPLVGAPHSGVSFAGLPSVMPTLVGQLLTGTALAGAPLVGAPVAGVPVVGAPVVGAPVVGAPVVGAPVAGVPVVGAPVVGAPLVGAPLVGAPLVGAPLELSVPGLLNNALIADTTVMMLPPQMVGGEKSDAALMHNLLAASKAVAGALKDLAGALDYLPGPIGMVGKMANLQGTADVLLQQSVVPFFGKAEKVNLQSGVIKAEPIKGKAEQIQMLEPHIPFIKNVKELQKKAPESKEGPRYDRRADTRFRPAFELPVVSEPFKLVSTETFEWIEKPAFTDFGNYFTEDLKLPIRKPRLQGVAKTMSEPKVADQLQQIAKNIVDTRWIDDLVDEFGKKTLQEKLLEATQNLTGGFKGMKTILNEPIKNAWDKGELETLIPMSRGTLVDLTQEVGKIDSDISEGDSEYMHMFSNLITLQSLPTMNRMALKNVMAKKFEGLSSRDIDALSDDEMRTQIERKINASFPVSIDLVHPLEIETTELKTRGTVDLVHPLDIETKEVETGRFTNLVHPLEIETIEAKTRGTVDLVHPLDIETAEVESRIPVPVYDISMVDMGVLKQAMANAQGITLDELEEYVIDNALNETGLRDYARDNIPDINFHLKSLGVGVKLPSFDGPQAKLTARELGAAKMYIGGVEKQDLGAKRLPFESLEDLWAWAKIKQENFEDVYIAKGAYNKAAEDYFDARNAHVNEETLAKLGAEARFVRNSIESEFGVNPAFELFNSNLVGMHIADKSPEEQEAYIQRHRADLWDAYQAEILSEDTSDAMVVKIAAEVDKIFGVSTSDRIIKSRHEHLRALEEHQALWNDYRQKIVNPSTSLQDAQNLVKEVEEIFGPDNGNLLLKERLQTQIAEGDHGDYNALWSEYNQKIINPSISLEEAQTLVKEVGEIYGDGTGITLLESRIKGQLAEGKQHEYDFLWNDYGQKIVNPSTSLKEAQNFVKEVGEIFGPDNGNLLLKVRIERNEETYHVLLNEYKEKILNSSTLLSSVDDLIKEVDQLFGLDEGTKLVQMRIDEDRTFGPTVMLSMGYTPEVILTANFPALELANAGFTVDQLADAGYSLLEIADTGYYHLTDLVAAGYKAEDLEAIDYAKDDIIAAGGIFAALSQATTTIGLSDHYLADLKRESSVFLTGQAKEVAEKKAWSELQTLFNKHNNALKSDDREMARKMRDAVDQNLGPEIASNLLDLYLLQAAQGMSPEQKATFLQNAYEEEIVVAAANRVTLEDSEKSFKDEMVRWICVSVEKILGKDLADDLWEKYQDPEVLLSALPIVPSNEDLKNLANKTLAFIQNVGKEMVDRVVSENLQKVSNAYQDAHDDGNPRLARQILADVEQTPDLGPNFATYLLNDYLFDLVEKIPEDQRKLYLQNAYEEELMSDMTSTVMAKNILQSVQKILGEDTRSQLYAKRQSMHPVEDLAEQVTVNAKIDHQEESKLKEKESRMNKRLSVSHREEDL